MKAKLTFTLTALLALATHAHAQGNAFTYQGRLQDGGAPAAGPHDFEFRLFNAATGGAQQGPTVTLDDLGVSNGLFTAALDFGANFPGADRFLQISVRPGASTGSYTPLTPRQWITATPYAVKALEAARLPAGALSSVMLADGAVTAGKLAPGAVSQLGASDGSPVNAVQVNTNGLVGIGTNAPQAGLHLSAGRPFINMEVVKTLRDENGGLTNLNYAAAVAVDGNLMAVVALFDSGVTLFDVTNPSDPGWTAQMRSGDSGFAGLGQVHRVALRSNLLAVASYDGVVSLLNVSDRYHPVLLAQLQDGLGGWNELSGINSLAFSGNLLAIAARGDSAVTLADVSNPANPIKRAELKDGFFGFTNLWGATALAFKGNTLFIGSDQDRAVTVVDVSNPANPVKLAEFKGGIGGFQPLGYITAMAVAGNTLAVSSDVQLTLVNVANPAAPVLAAQLNATTQPAITVTVSALASSGNLLAVAYQYLSAAVVLDVSQPAVPVVYAATTRVGGEINTQNSFASVAFAQTNLMYTLRDASLVSVVRMTPRRAGLVSEGWVGIGVNQPEAPLHLMGDLLVESANRVTIRTRSVNLGLNNTVEGDRATVGGGALNYAATQGNTIAGGGGNYTSGDWASIGGGYENRASGFVSTVGGGERNQAQTNHSVVGGGYVNVAKGLASVVPGGSQNVAAGDYSAALGRQAQANHAGSLVWADAQGTDFSSTLTNQFSVRASGGVRLETGGAGLTVDGQRVLTTAGGSQPLEFFVSGERALRLEPTVGTPNLIGGFSGNTVSSGVVGAVIAGGGVNGLINRATANYSAVLGGAGNWASGLNAAVVGGLQNQATAEYSAVLGGG